MGSIEEAAQRLGVGLDATMRQIGTAYRKLAKVHHPDAGGDPEMFRELTEAYELLRGAAGGRRARTSTRKTPRTGGENKGAGPSAGTGRDGPGRSALADLEKADHLAGIDPGGTPGGTRMVELHVELAQAVFGTRVELHVDRLDPCELCTGMGGLTVACRRCGDSGRTVRQYRLELSVPAGTVDRHRIVYPRMGDAGERAGERDRRVGGPGPRGDLVVEVHVRDHPTIRRRGDDLWATWSIDMLDAVLGCRFSAELLDGTVTVQVPGGCQHEQLVAVPNRGVPRSGGGRGRFVIEILVHTWGDVDEVERPVLEQLRARRAGMYRRPVAEKVPPR